MKKALFVKSLSVSLPGAVYEKIREMSDDQEVSMGEIARTILSKKVVTTGANLANKKRSEDAIWPSQ